MLCNFIRYNVSSIILLSTQWNICTEICQLLKVFNDATYTLFSVYYPTTSLFIIKALSIVGAFDECMSQELELELKPH